VTQVDIAQSHALKSMQVGFQVWASKLVVTTVGGACGTIVELASR
jgi:methionine synthase I (cobalamin-dependent)